MRPMFHALLAVLTACGGAGPTQGDTGGPGVDCDFFAPTATCAPFEACCTRAASRDGWAECWYETEQGVYDCDTPYSCGDAYAAVIGEVCD